MNKPIKQPASISSNPSQSQLTSKLPRTIFKINGKINNCLSPEDICEGEKEQERIIQLFSDFEEEVNVILHKVGYNKNSYISKLSLSQEQLNEDIKIIFETHSNLSQIVQKILSLYPDSNKKQKVYNGLKKEYLDNVVYESNKRKNNILVRLNDVDGFKNITVDNYKKFIDEKAKIFEGKKILLNLHYADFEIFSNQPEEFFNFMDLIVEKWNCIGIDALEIYCIFGNDLALYSKFIKNLAKKGLKDIGIGSGVCARKGVDYYIQLSKLVSKSGIKSFDFRNFILNNAFCNDLESIFDFLEPLCDGTVKELIFWGNRFGEFFKNSKNLKKFVKIAGKGGIKYLNLGYNNLVLLFWNNTKELIDLIRVAGINGIKNLDISHNNFYKLFKGKPDELIELVRVAGEVGIKGLNLSNNEIMKVFYKNTRKFRIFMNIVSEYDIDIGNLGGESGDKITINYFKKAIKIIEESNYGVLDLGNLGLYHILDITPSKLIGSFEGLQINKIETLKMNYSGFSHIFKNNSEDFLVFINTLLSKSITDIYLNQNVLRDIFDINNIDTYLNFLSNLQNETGKISNIYFQDERKDIFENNPNELYKSEKLIKDLRKRNINIIFQNYNYQTHEELGKNQ